MQRKCDCMELIDTVGLMINGDYKDRFVAEYQQAGIRLDRLRKMISQYDAGALNFEPANINLLREQAAVMEKYLYILGERAKLEKIRL